jgi:hypothetical protein
MSSMAIAHAAMNPITPASGSQRRHPVLRPGSTGAVGGSPGPNAGSGAGTPEGTAATAPGLAESAGEAGSGEVGGADVGWSGDPPGATSAMPPA